LKALAKEKKVIFKKFKRIDKVTSVSSLYQVLDCLFHSYHALALDLHNLMKGPTRTEFAQELFDYFVCREFVTISLEDKQLLVQEAQAEVQQAVLKLETYLTASWLSGVCERSILTERRVPMRPQTRRN
jgi:hypothetical protein